MNRPSRSLMTLVALAAVVGTTRSASAQEVQPELTLGVLSLGSVGGEFSGGANGGDGAAGLVDFSDTSLLLRGRIQLYPDIRGGSVVGLQFPDADSALGTVFFHQAYVFIQGRHFDVKLGRSRLQSSIVEFPTVRDDDLLPYSDALNPFSTGSTTEDHQYGNVLEVTGNLASTFFLSVHAEHLFLTPGDQASSDFTLNSFGSTITYRNIPARIDNERIREAGVGVNYYDARGDGRAATWNVIAAGAVNVVPDPIHLIDARAQGIFNNGDASASLSDPNSTFRVRSVRGTAALRYLYSRAMIPTLQLAAVGGFARYIDDGNASSWSGAVNGFYSLGARFDLGLQYVLRRDSSQVRSALGTPEYGHSVQAVLRFGFEFAVNTLPNRDSILNNEHGYIP